MKTTNLAFLYSLPSFLVPYLYVYSNELLLMGSIPMVLIRVFSAFIGISCMAVTFHGFLFRNIGWLERSLFLLGGLLIVYPHGWTMVAGYVLIALLTTIQFLKRRSDRLLSVAAG